MNFNIDSFNVFPLFPNTIGICEIKENLDNLKKIEYFDFFHKNEFESGITKSFNLLDSFQKEKEIIISYFNRFKNNIMQYDNTNFVMTTSWGTRCLKNQVSEYHNHKNCFFSAVLYLDDVDAGGELIFSNSGLNVGNLLLNRADNINPFNTDSFYIRPKKNTIVIFPSFLMHKISRYFGENPRYSIAMNFMPTGILGYDDSSINVDVNPHIVEWGIQKN